MTYMTPLLNYPDRAAALSKWVRIVKLRPQSMALTAPKLAAGLSLLMKPSPAKIVPVQVADVVSVVVAAAVVADAAADINSFCL